MRKFTAWLFVLILSLSTLARACIVLGQDSSQPPYITGEQAVIIWDDVHKVEHFIRQANIDTKEANLGFLVPTPRAPELAEADPLIFTFAEQETAPKIVPDVIEETPFQFIHRALAATDQSRIFTTISSTLAVAAAASAPNGIEVLSEQDVADYHATVLAADDAASLRQWLTINGYAWNESDAAWLEPYLKAKWKITAFKLIRKTSDSDTATIQSRAIRMSFRTDRPFFPYSEPADARTLATNRGGNRSLGVALLGSMRMSGAIEDGHAWPGKLRFFGALPLTDHGTTFLRLAKLDPEKNNVSVPDHLTYFVDDSNPRPGTADLYFTPATDQSNFQEVIVDHDLPKDYEMDWKSPVAIIESAAIAFALFSLPAWVLVNSFRKTFRRSTEPSAT